MCLRKQDDQKAVSNIDMASETVLMIFLHYLRKPFRLKIMKYIYDKKIRIFSHPGITALRKQERVLLPANILKGIYTIQYSSTA